MIRNKIHTSDRKEEVRAAECECDTGNVSQPECVKTTGQHGGSVVWMNAINHSENIDNQIITII